MGIILALLLFSFIVFFHEFGHFLLAKLNGIDVYEFAIGMGPAIFSKEYKGTKYAIRILPIGGYCAMGEDDEVSDSPGNFNNKSVWARISVIAAGAVFNFILAFIMSVIIIGMTGYDSPVIGEVDAGFPAAEAATRQDFEKRLAVYPDHFWLLEDENGKLVSFVNGMVTDEPELRDEMYADASLHQESGAWQMIFGVNTLPEYRRQGIGSQLMVKMLELLKWKGYKMLESPIQVNSNFMRNMEVPDDADYYS